MDKNVLPIPPEDKLSIHNTVKMFLSMCHMHNFSTSGIENTFISILGIDNFYILCIDNTSTNDVDKNKISTSQM